MRKSIPGVKATCPLNLLSSPIGESGPLNASFRKLFEAFVNALTDVVIDAGCPANIARDRAERGVALIQGSLVLARGLGSTEPFRKMLQSLPDELLAGTGDSL